MSDEVKKNKRRKAIRIIAAVGFFICAMALLYPVISNSWNSYRESQLISEYNDTVNDESSQEQNSQMIYDARQYNSWLAGASASVVTNTEYEKDDTYESLLDPDGDGMIGYIEIPCIDVKNAIYHYSTEEILSNGVGHIHGSSLPVGGENTHSVLTGHRGLPSGKFFSDLDKVTVGDKFYIHVLDETYAYEVYDIETVLPEEVSSLVIESGEDITTLVTCTPYGVNTYRLLVTGRRIAFDEENVGDDGLVSSEQHHYYMDPAFAVLCGVLFFILIVVIIILIRRKSKKKKRQDDNGSV